MAQQAPILPVSVPVPELQAVPRALNIEIATPTYIHYCGVVCDDNNEFVLVSVVRHRAAAADVGYKPPALSFLTHCLSEDVAVVRANLRWRLPRDDDELRMLVAALKSA